ncbi:alkyl sulfatase dimerization domain-containing protein [Pseudonocardia nematodicida]|uniref:Alkyl sulfatase dimerization domain-containing protein n=1 Tax=Pseudonocardia nematodicida TaxID=1206997 RepID=A0ABV1K8H5_9PSEU
MIERTSSAAASPATVRANAAAGAALPLSDPTDRHRAERGLLRRAERLVVHGDRTGAVIRDSEDYTFLDDEQAPESVHPSLWRHARLNNSHGLYEVCDGLYQVRGYDLANLTLVRGEVGWIVIDPLTVTESARAAMALATEVLGERPVTAVIYTHSHKDHYGGVAGVISPEEARDRGVPIIAPAGFVAEVVSESVIAGPAMGRRATYQFGRVLDRGVLGQLDNGIGKVVPNGETTFLAPTVDITHTGQELVVDGVRIVFQMTPEAEAPAEMMFHFPDLNALCVAENCNATMHNLYTLRGAQVRDALAWSGYIQEALELFGETTDVCFGSHNWPRFGRDDVREFLAHQRDLYRWLHDQTMRLANHGRTPVEIAEELTLPAALASDFSCRGYYGTVSHNVKAVYQRYLGWFDGNPAHLDPLPDEESAARTLRYMGGIDAVVERAREDFDAGDLRWVAEVLGRAVFAEPEHSGARLLLADTFEQLAYRAEASIWRNFYLTGAEELRHGIRPVPAQAAAAQRSILAALPTAELLDWVGVRIDGPRADGTDLRTELTFPDRDERWAVGVRNGTIHYWPKADPGAALLLTLPRTVFEELLVGSLTVAGLDGRADVRAEGDLDVLEGLLDVLDTFTGDFAIVEP